ncbi:type II toxin-antitoxin system PemK/MazF family toxin [Salinicoccus kekensis]|uniref:Endoribonuclease MazF n=1 Tax=Salinicoccus kekensis TaxID=714307 RepID=A0A285UKM1_9STAP|nr:type II toxin-antitoxin system PemK/MazF family toxin [Salinicoccus kekensis]SOC41156.1 mRNA interferase MazF [Salinicoccus kekensis]
MVNQYDVIMIDLDPVKGREKGRYRPCVVVSNSTYNQRVRKVWAIPVTSRDLKYPTDVPIETIEGNIHGVIDCSEIRTLDLIERPFKVKDRINMASIVRVNDVITTIMQL